MLSQDSLANYAEDAEKEAILERKRLALQDSERKQFANAIISQTSHHNENGNQAVETGPTPNQGLVFSFGKSAPKNRFGRKDSGSTKKERLEELLQKTEQYTKFILQQNIKHHRAMQRQQFAESILNGDMDGHGAKMNGKSSISKRRQNKRPGQNAAENSSEEED
jgi:SNF2 family DNA or RNA helicase